MAPGVGTTVVYRGEHCTVLKAHGSMVWLCPPTASSGRWVALSECEPAPPPKGRIPLVSATGRRRAS